MRKLRDKRLFLLDMDGTIYLGDRVFDGTLDLLRWIKDHNGRYMFLTNNSSKSVDRYIEKLNHMRIPAIADDFVTSAQATGLYLQQHHIQDRIYVFGTQHLKRELASYHLKVTDKPEDDVSCLVMGFDTELTFQKLVDATVLLNRGVAYIATNPDWVCPTEYGYVPDCGSVAEMLYRATKRKPRFIGKPESAMIDLAIQKTGYTKEDAIILGDRIYTDIKSGYNAEIDTLLVLSGESTVDDLKDSDVAPTYIYQNVRELYYYLSESDR